LESAGCKNCFEIQFGTQRVVLCLTLSIAKPSLPVISASSLSPPAPQEKIKIARWDRGLADAPGSESLDLTKSSLRSPRAILALRTAPDRLPPVTLTPGLQVGRLPPVPKPLANEPSISIGSSPMYAENGTINPAKSSNGFANAAKQSAGSDRCDGQIDLEASLHSNGSSLCELATGSNEALTGNMWPQMSSLSGQGPFDQTIRQAETGRPGTRQEKRRPQEVTASRCEAWGSSSFARQGSSGGFAPQPSPGRLGTQASMQSRPQKFHQSASSSGGFGSVSTMTGAEQSSLASVATGSRSPPQTSTAGSMPQTPTEGSTPHGGCTDLDVLAGGDRWFQTSISCSLSQPELGTHKKQLPRRQQQRQQQQHVNANIYNFPPGVVIDQFGANVPPAANGGRRGKVAVVELSAGLTEDGRPPTRCGMRPGRIRLEQAAGGGGMAMMDGAIAGLADMEMAPPSPASLARTSSLPALSAPAPRNARTFRVSDLME